MRAVQRRARGKQPGQRRVSALPRNRDQTGIQSEFSVKIWGYWHKMNVLHEIRCPVRQRPAAISRWTVWSGVADSRSVTGAEKPGSDSHGDGMSDESRGMRSRPHEGAVRHLFDPFLVPRSFRVTYGTKLPVCPPIRPPTPASVTAFVTTADAASGLRSRCGAGRRVWFEPPALGAVRHSASLGCRARRRV